MLLFLFQENEITKPQMYQNLLSLLQISSKKKKKFPKRYFKPYAQEFFCVLFLFLIRIA